MRQPQLAQARVPRDPRGCISADSSLNSAPRALGREEGSGVLGGSDLLIQLSFFPQGTLWTQWRSRQLMPSCGSPFPTKKLI